MALDKYVAEQRRFARLLGTGSHRSGLPVGSALEEPTASESTTNSRRLDSVPADD